MFQITVSLCDGLESLYPCYLEGNSSKQKENSPFVAITLTSVIILKAKFRKFKPY